MNQFLRLDEVKTHKHHENVTKYIRPFNAQVLPWMVLNSLMSLIRLRLRIKRPYKEQRARACFRDDCGSTAARSVAPR